MTRNIIKMQSYQAIKDMNLSKAEVRSLLKALIRRGKLVIVRKALGPVHLCWTGALDSNSPAHPGSTSVRVSLSSFLEVLSYRAIRHACIPPCLCLTVDLRACIR